MEEAHKLAVNTRKHVPVGARVAWGECLAKAAHEVTEHNDLLAWTEWSMLAKAVLGTPKGRGGAAHRKRVEVDVKAKCRQWADGERAALWKAARESVAKRGRPPQVDVQGALLEERPEEGRVREILREGQLNKAVAALVSEPPVEVTREVIGEMRDKHPPPREGEREKLGRLRAVHKSAAPSINGEEAIRLVRTFPRGSASGPSGLKPQHLADACSPGNAAEVGRQLAGIVGTLLGGEVPEEVRPWISCAQLAALPKPGGGLRPIAVGETIRRLTAKAAMAAQGESIREALEPVQVGVGTPGGRKPSPTRPGNG